MIVTIETSCLNFVVAHDISPTAVVVVLFDPLPAARHELLRPGVVIGPAKEIAGRVFVDWSPPNFCFR